MEENDAKLHRFFYFFLSLILLQDRIQNKTKIGVNPLNPFNSVGNNYFQCNSNAKHVFSPFVMLNVAAV